MCDPSPGNRTAQETTNCTEKSLVCHHCLFPRKTPSCFVGFPLGLLLRCSAAEQIRAVELNLSFSQMCDSILTHSQNSFSFKKPPLWSGKSALLPELWVLQPASNWWLHSWKSFPIGGTSYSSIKNLLACWTGGRERESFKGWETSL